MGKCKSCNKEENLNENGVCENCHEEIEESITKLSFSQVKDITKIVDKKLAKNAKREKKLKDQEEQDLEEQDEDFTHDRVDQRADMNANTTKKIVFLVGLCGVFMVLVGVAKEKYTHE